MPLLRNVLCCFVYSALPCLLTGFATIAIGENDMAKREDMRAVGMNGSLRFGRTQASIEPEIVLFGVVEKHFRDCVKSKNIKVYAM